LASAGHGHDRDPCLPQLSGHGSLSEGLGCLEDPEAAQAFVVLMVAWMYSWRRPYSAWSMLMHSWNLDTEESLLTP
jgi:hypothetical protein